MINQRETALQIEASKSKRVVEVKWGDGHVSRYGFSLLRAACPCAGCRGGHENMRSEPDEDIFLVELGESDATMLAQIEAVGGYGIRLTWQDGHSDGIFTWHYLRELCSCAECRDEK
ncbi:hypothetical protein ADN00_13740 [Ornatilinea apprima]|uniref:Gamma-butyrobetaine hydroxylase-like N-terminal domain-containing protein n=1 Tax=Ornatilinea apprima TaxID=1134406 RepID=A0A0P6X0J1_9CHLR|nr:DUF971 domain-containing protein [Ornatilinea apprima]KPL74355.1 hypothetical protein ADN00_13740 [Ornatilinea apprima]